MHCGFFGRFFVIVWVCKVRLHVDDAKENGCSSQEMARMVRIRDMLVQVRFPGCGFIM